MHLLSNANVQGYKHTFSFDDIDTTTFMIAAKSYWPLPSFQGVAAIIMQQLPPPPPLETALRHVTVLLYPLEATAKRVEEPNHALVAGADLGMGGVSPAPWEGDACAQTAHETFNGRASAVTSRQHSVLVWFALRERQGKTLNECRTIEVH